MKVKSIAEYSKGEHSAILLTFIKLPIVIMIFVLSVFEWPCYVGFTALVMIISFLIRLLEPGGDKICFCCVSDKGPD